MNPARPGDKPAKKVMDRIKYLKPKRLKSLQHKLIDEGLSLGAVGIACALPRVFLLAWCRRRYRKRGGACPSTTVAGKGHKQRGLFGSSPSEVLPNDVAQAADEPVDRRRGLA